MTAVRMIVLALSLGAAWMVWPPAQQNNSKARTESEVLETVTPQADGAARALAGAARAETEILPELLRRAADLGGEIDPKALALASRLKKIHDGNPFKDCPPVFCYDQDTDEEAMQRVWELVPELSPHNNRYQFNDNNRWGGAAEQGNPTVITWSLVPDGLSVDGGTSVLFERLDAQFGNRSLWLARIEQSFARWAELTGTSYVRVTAPGVDWDDGAPWFSAGSAERGDVRISSILIDGGSGVLAYNYFPQVGDMVLDSAESWGTNSSNGHRFFRNVLMHEHGHGLGFNHVCPIYGLWLMEPFLNTGFDGPQHDDIRAGHRGYGDAFEPNDSPGAAADVGTVVFGSPIVIGTVPPPAVTNGSTASIDGDLDDDWFRFTVIADSTATVTVSPVGLEYDNSPQQCSGQTASCCFFNFVDSNSVSNLNVALFDSDGTTLIASAAENNNGEPESLSMIELPSGPGDYYIRISKQDAGNTSQMYKIDLSVVTVGADVSTPQPDPIGFEVPPSPIDTVSLTMTANEASDATHPVEYHFDFVSGGSGGGPDSPWQASRSFVDLGLLPNRNYTYRVRARDSSPFPGPNTGAFSATVQGTTHIETPAGVTLGTVTETTIDMMLTPPLPSFYTVDLSGILFESTTPGGNDGINEWIQSTSDNAVNLTPNTAYSFRAKARNRLAIETIAWSPEAEAVTLAATPAAPGLANPSSVSMKIDPDPAANPGYTELSVRCVASAPLDPTWDSQYLDATGQPSAAPVWRSDTDWGNQTVFGMQPDTQYTFVVRARNLDGIETADGLTASLMTLAPGFCNLLGDINDDTALDGDDISGFIRVKLGIPDGGDQINCADYGNGDPLLDTEDFVEDLLGQP